MKFINKRTLSKGYCRHLCTSGCVHFFQTVASWQVKARKVGVVDYLKLTQHRYLRTKNKLCQCVCLCAASKNKLLKNRKRRKAHVRKSTPRRQVQFLHPFTTVQVEYCSNVGHLVISITPFHIFSNLLMHHCITFTTEFKIEITKRSSLYCSTCSTISFERYISCCILSRTISCIK